MPVSALVDDCPLYDLAPARPTTPIYPPPAVLLAREASPRDVLLALLSCPNIASRRPLYEQYDSIVQSRTVRRPEEADAAVLAIQPESAHARVSEASGDGIDAQTVGPGDRLPHSPSRSTATAAASPPTRIRARSRLCSSARPT